MNGKDPSHILSQGPASDLPQPLRPWSAVIFDMDGVIVDSEPRHERAFRDVFDALGYGDSHGMDFTAYYGKSDRTLWLDFVARHQPPQSLDELIDLKQGRFFEIIRQDSPIFPEIPGLLHSLAERHPLALASGSAHPVIDVVLDLANLRRHFRAIVSSQDVPRGKPAPDVFLHAAERIQVPPGECVVIEDSEAGVEAGRAAGMQVIGITNTLPASRLSRADRVVASFRQIEALLLGGG